MYAVLVSNGTGYIEFLKNDVGEIRTFDKKTEAEKVAENKEQVIPVRLLGKCKACGRAITNKDACVKFFGDKGRLTICNRKSCNKKINLKLMEEMGLLAK